MTKVKESYQDNGVNIAKGVAWLIYSCDFDLLV